MKIPIKDLEHKGVAYRGDLRSVVFNAGAGEWQGTAVWRSPEKFQKTEVAGADLNALVTAAIQVIIPRV